MSSVSNDCEIEEATGTYTGRRYFWNATCGFMDVSTWYFFGRNGESLGYVYLDPDSTLSLKEHLKIRGWVSDPLKESIFKEEDIEKLLSLLKDPKLGVFVCEEVLLRISDLETKHEILEMINRSGRA